MMTRVTFLHHHPGASFPLINGSVIYISNPDPGRKTMSASPLWITLHLSVVSACEAGLLTKNRPFPVDVLWKIRRIPSCRLTSTRSLNIFSIPHRFCLVLALSNTIAALPTAVPSDLTPCLGRRASLPARSCGYNRGWP